jgi:hypothetical protein
MSLRITHIFNLNNFDTVYLEWHLSYHFPIDSRLCVLYAASEIFVYLDLNAHQLAVLCLSCTLHVPVLCLLHITHCFASFDFFLLGRLSVQEETFCKSLRLNISSCWPFTFCWYEYSTVTVTSNARQYNIVILICCDPCLVIHFHWDLQVLPQILHVVGCLNYHHWTSGTSCYLTPWSCTDIPTHLINFWTCPTHTRMRTCTYTHTHI